MITVVGRFFIYSIEWKLVVVFISCRASDVRDTRIWRRSISDNMIGSTSSKPIIHVSGDLHCIYTKLMLWALTSTHFFPHIEQIPFLWAQSLQKFIFTNTFDLQIRHILSFGIHWAEILFNCRALFVFPAFTHPPLPLLLPTQFLAPSFHLSGTDSWVSFVWQESQTII